jgi:hypothetical protein
MPSVEILQNDIFGVGHKVSQTQDKRERSSETGSTKSFRNISLNDGVSESVATNDSMLIHRILQRKIMYSNKLDKDKKRVLFRILCNELNIKSGNVDAYTASRDSLIAFFIEKLGDHNFNIGL